MGTPRSDDPDEGKEAVNSGPASRVFPPKFVCKGIEKQAGLHAEAKQAFLEQTGPFLKLRSLLDERPGNTTLDE